MFIKQKELLEWLFGFTVNHYSSGLYLPACVLAEVNSLQVYCVYWPEALNIVHKLDTFYTHTRYRIQLISEKKMILQDSGFWTKTKDGGWVNSITQRWWVAKFHYSEGGKSCFHVLLPSPLQSNNVTLNENKRIELNVLISGDSQLPCSERLYLTTDQLL